MKNSRNSEATYLDFLNFYYQNGFPSLLGGVANSVAMGIAYKWNSLIRPAEFKMANSELCHLSGVESNVGRSRQRVCDLCKVAGIPLFTYASNGTRRAGTYRINVNLLSDYNQFNINLTSNYHHIDNDLRDQRSEKETENDHDRGSPENENEEKTILTGTTASDHTIVLGALMRKWGSQIINQPPLSHVTGSLQEFPRETLLEAIDRAPLVLKEADPMKIMAFVISVAEHPHWYMDKAHVAEIQNEDAKESAKRRRLVHRCEKAIMEAIDEGAETEIFGCVRFLARHTDRQEEDVFSDYAHLVSRTLDYYRSVWVDPGQEGYE